MVEIDFYTDDQYESVKALLKSVDLFDETWETRENLKLKIEKDSESIILAKIDGIVIGCVFVVVDGWIGMVWRLCVDKAYRRQGIGGKLLNEAESLIKKCGIKEVSLFVRNDNEDLKEWYEKDGYSKTSDYTFLYKEIKD